MSIESAPTAKVPPRWFIRGAWLGHRAIHRATRGRRGLATPVEGGRFGYLRLLTTGRRSGRERAAILGYLEDGDRYVTLAMNGWSAADPAWWLNLRADPEATVELKGARLAVRAREATGGERDRLWALLDGTTGYGDIDAFTRQRRPGGTAVVVLEPD